MVGRVSEAWPSAPYHYHACGLGRAWPLETVQKILPRVRASHTHTHTTVSPPGVVYGAARAGARERSGRSRPRALGATRVPRPRLRARAGKPASWPAISVLITADVAVHSGLINYSAWGISASNKQSLNRICCLSVCPSSLSLWLTALVGELWQRSGRKRQLIMSSHLPLLARDEAANGRFGSSDLYVFPNLTYARVPSSVSFSFLIDVEYYLDYFENVIDT